MLENIHAITLCRASIHSKLITLPLRNHDLVGVPLRNFREVLVMSACLLHTRNLHTRSYFYISCPKTTVNVDGLFGIGPDLEPTKDKWGASLICVCGPTVVQPYSWWKKRIASRKLKCFLGGIPCCIFQGIQADTMEKLKKNNNRRRKHPSCETEGKDKLYVAIFPLNSFNTPLPVAGILTRGFFVLYLQVFIKYLYLFSIKWLP